MSSAVAFYGLVVIGLHGLEAVRYTCAFGIQLCYDEEIMGFGRQFVPVELPTHAARRYNFPLLYGG